MKPIIPNTSLEARKNNKPLMEKRRRARINDCLAQLKVLVLQAMNRDGSAYSKLEKADILEMTVKYLRSLQRQNLLIAATREPNVVEKFRTGFAECASEVQRYLLNVEATDPQMRGALLTYLNDCIQTMNASTQAAPPSSLYSMHGNRACPYQIPRSVGNPSHHPTVGHHYGGLPASMSNMPGHPPSISNVEAALMHKRMSDFHLITSSSTNGNTDHDDHDNNETLSIASSTESLDRAPLDLTRSSESETNCGREPTALQKLCLMIPDVASQGIHDRKTSRRTSLPESTHTSSCPPDCTSPHHDERYTANTSPISQAGSIPDGAHQTLSTEVTDDSNTDHADDQEADNEVVNILNLPHQVIVKEEPMWRPW